MTVNGTSTIRPGRSALSSRSLNSLNTLQRVELPDISNDPPPLPSTSSLDAANTPREIERLFREFLNFTTARAQNHLLQELDTITDSSENENSFALQSVRVISCPSKPTYKQNRRRSFPREYKLKAIQYYKCTVVEIQPEIYQAISKRLASKKLGITPAMLRDWLAKEAEIQVAEKGKRDLGPGKSAQWPELESRLFRDFCDFRAKGQSINQLWFIRAARRLFAELYPDKVRISSDGEKIYGCKFSDGWFSGFRCRWRIAYRAKTKQAQKAPIEAQPSIIRWMQFNRRCSQLRLGERQRDIGRYYLCNIYNMDQTPLPFEFLDGKTYDFKGNKTIWVRALRPGWSKRQATLMITVCGDGVPRCYSLIIFRGECVGANVIAEQLHYHPRVRVEFNSKAYSNEDITLKWIHHDLKWATDFDPTGNLPRLVALDVFAGQKTPKVLKAFKSLNMTTSFIPEGCTSLVQPLYTSINKILKNRISQLIDEEMDRNPNKWDDKAFNVSDRRILITHCVGEAWEWLHRERKDMIVKAFRQVGLTLPIDGSQDSEIKIKDLPDIVVGNWHEGGIDCNLNRMGKTSDGSDINLDADEANIYMPDITRELEHLAHSPEDEEYILETGPTTQEISREWAIRVSGREKKDLANSQSQSEREQVVRAAMQLDFLCSN